MLPLLFCNLSKVLKMIIALSRSLARSWNNELHKCTGSSNRKSRTIPANNNWAAIRWWSSLAKYNCHHKASSPASSQLSSIDRIACSEQHHHLWVPHFALLPLGSPDCRDQWSQFSGLRVSSVRSYGRFRPWTPSSADWRCHLYTCCCGSAVDRISVNFVWYPNFGYLTLFQKRRLKCCQIF